MKHPHLLKFALAGLILISLNGLPVISQGLVEKSAPWDRIICQDYLIENVTWNVQAAKSPWTETIFCDTLHGAMGWRWNFSGEPDLPENYTIKTFPEIIFGQKPYKGYNSTTTMLPVNLTSAQFQIDYEYAANATGIYNTSTDISFTDSRNPDESNIRAKLMIWFDQKNMPFYSPEKLKQVVIDEISYKVFIDTTHTGPEGKWNLIALLPDHFHSKGTINLHKYINFLVEAGALQPGWYLSSIEMGSEIASGKGEVVFKKFVVHAN